MGVIRVEATDGRKTIHIGPIRVMFAWDGTVWNHFVRIGDETTPEWSAFALHSSDPAEARPPDGYAVYQEVEIDEVAGQVRALALGVAGPHHYSAVFSAWSANDARLGPRVGVSVDLADRCRVPVANPAAFYLVATDYGKPWRGEPNQMIWGAGDDPPRHSPGPITASCLDDGRVDLFGLTSGHVELGFRMRATDLMGTRRLRYEITAADPAVGHS